MKFLSLAALAVVGAGFAFSQAPTIAGCPTFPANNIWNTPIDTLPVDANSAAYINNISATTGLRSDPSIPINIVPGTQPLVAINIYSPDESDPGPFPIPPYAVVEPGSDAHVIVIDKDHCMLYETFASSLNPDGSWNVGSSAKWSLLSNALRPAYWTSADAAGLPIMPGVVRYDEMLSGQINHALRFTAPHTQRLFLWPARHYASSNTSPTLPPMGQRFRLKASFDISGFSPNMQVILRAIKKYGLILADNGLPWFIQFDYDSRWDALSNDLYTLRSVLGSNLEAVDESTLMIDPDSGQALQPGTISVTVTPPSANLQAGQSQQFTASVSGSSLGVNWSMNPQLGTLSSTGNYTAPGSVSGSPMVTITATLTDGSKSGSATVTVQQLAPATVSALSVAPSSVTGGTNVNAMVTLSSPAPTGGAAVTLIGSNSAFPTATVTVAQGQSSQTFSVATATVSSSTGVTVTASYNNTGASAPLTVMPTGAPPSATAAFVKTDTATAGNWKGVYGGDGYNVIGDNASYPAYTTVNPHGNMLYVWASSTTDPRGLQKSASTTDRIAATWYTSNGFDVDVNITDGKFHQVAFYVVDWDTNQGRSQQIAVFDFGTNALLDSRTVSSFSGGQYLVWNLSGHVVVRITNLNASSNAVLSGIFFGAAVATAPGGTAAFVKADTTTAGNWKTAYGAEGYNVIGDSASYPAYAAVTPSGKSDWIWTSSTTDPRGLQKAALSTDRIASCWYSGNTFTLDMNISGTTARQVALYMVDWDNYFGRNQRIDILDANTGNVLDTRTISNFIGGQYLVWNLSGHVMVRITNLNTSSNAVLSGIFFGAGMTAAPGGTAAFVKADTTTAGNWKTAYGADGYSVIGDSASYPAYAAVSPSGNSSYTWAASTTDARGLQKAASTSDRIASCWYNGNTFTLDINISGTTARQVALYMVDWDNYFGRNQRIDILDANTGNVLDTRTVSSFVAGQYLVWNLSGHVVVRLTNLNAPSNAVLSGIFFGAAPTAATAAFIKADTTTQGTWKGIYGADGYNVIGDNVSYPAYAAVTPSGKSDWVWTASTTDPRGLQKVVSTTDRIASCWYSGSTFTVDMNISGTTARQVALYMVDWDNYNGRSERIDILDANAGNVLDTRTVSSFVAGQYLVWNLSGHVVVRITNVNASSNAVLSGIFFR